MILILQSFHMVYVAADWMVIPLCFSSSMLSIVAPTPSLPFTSWMESILPVQKRIRSVRVVFPESIWAEIPILRSRSKLRVFPLIVRATVKEGPKLLGRVKHFHIRIPANNFILALKSIITRYTCTTTIGIGFGICFYFEKYCQSRMHVSNTRYNVSANMTYITYME